MHSNSSVELTINTKLPKENSYEIKDEERLNYVREAIFKIDSFFMKVLKVLLAVIIFTLAINYNLILGIGVLMVEGLFLIYYNTVQEFLIEYVQDVKENVEGVSSKVDFLLEDSISSKIKLLVALLFIGLFLEFSMVLIICFAVLFLFTVGEIIFMINRTNDVIKIKSNKINFIKK